MVDENKLIHGISNAYSFVFILYTIGFTRLGHRTVSITRPTTIFSYELTSLSNGSNVKSFRKQKFLFLVVFPFRKQFDAPQDMIFIWLLYNFMKITVILNLKWQKKRNFYNNNNLFQWNHYQYASMISYGKNLEQKKKSKI